MQYENENMQLNPAVQRQYFTKFRKFHLFGNIDSVILMIGIMGTAQSVIAAEGRKHNGIQL